MSNVFVTTCRTIAFALPVAWWTNAASEPPAGLPVLDCVIEPYEIIEVSSAAEGVIERVHVERNDLVTRGQVLAELESEVEKASLAYAELNAALESEIRLRRASLDFDQRNQERVETLYTQNAIPLHHKDEADTDAAKSRWLLTKAEDDKRLAALEYARARAVVKRKTVRSPISGVVIARHKSTGEYIEDQPIVTVAQLHPLRVEVIAPVELFGAIENGMQAEIVPELAMADRLTATVMSVDRVVDGASGTFDVRLELPNPDYAIPSGLKCQIEFTGDVALPAAPAADEPAPVLPAPQPALLRGAASGDSDSMDDEGRTRVTEASPPVPVGAAETADPQALRMDLETAEDDAQAGAVCRAIGPISTEDRVRSLVTALEPHGVVPIRTERLERTPHSYLLLSPRAETDAAQSAIRQRIASTGLTDTALLYKGSHKDRFSFGVYNNEHVAKIQQRLLTEKGFEIEIVPRVREQSRIWLELNTDPATLPDGTLAALAGRGGSGGNLEITPCTARDVDESAIAEAPRE